MIARRSQWRSASSIRCVVTRIVVPASSRSACEVLPHHPPGGRVEADGRLVEEQHGGRLSSAVAISRRRSIPPESVRARRSSIGSRSIVSIACSIRSRALAPRDAGHARVEVEVLARRQRAVDGDRLRDVADRGAHGEAFRAHVVARRRARGPSVGGSSVVSTRIVVVLPAPLGPSRPNTSPGATAKETPPTAVDLVEAHDEVVDEHRRVGGVALTCAASSLCELGRRARRRRERALGARVELADLAPHALARLATARARAWPARRRGGARARAGGRCGRAPRCSSSRRRAGSTSSRRSCGAHLGARLLGARAASSAPRARRRAGLSGASPRAGARPRPRCTGGARPDGRAGASGSRPISS